MNLLQYHTYLNIQEGEQEEESQRVDPGEVDALFAMIRKLENRRFLIDAKDPNHSKRDMVTSGWNEVASDIKVNNEQVTSKLTCQHVLSSTN